MISDIEHDFPQKYIKKAHMGLLTETHEVLLRLTKTPNIHVFQDGGTHRRPYPPDHIVVQTISSTKVKCLIM